MSVSSLVQSVFGAKKSSEDKLFDKLVGGYIDDFHDNEPYQGLTFLKAKGMDEHHFTKYNQFLSQQLALIGRMSESYILSHDDREAETDFTVEQGTKILGFYEKVQGLTQVLEDCARNGTVEEGDYAGRIESLKEKTSEGISYLFTHMNPIAAEKLVEGLHPEIRGNIEEIRQFGL